MVVWAQCCGFYFDHTGLIFWKACFIHFWSLIFVWAGPHHLMYTSVGLGTIFSIMLIAPSWVGMLNGLLTLRGAWDKVRENPILKFFVVSVTCYGPMLATKTLNSRVHFSYMERIYG